MNEPQSNLAILCPITSRGCSEDVAEQPIFKALLPSMEAVGLFGEAQLILGYDRDDPIWSTKENRDRVSHPVLWLSVDRGLANGLTGIWNVMAALWKDWAYSLPANDDLAFQTSPLPAIEDIRSRRDFGIVGFHDHAFPGLTTFYVVGRVHFEIFGCLYPVPWPGAHQDSWIADVYRPWAASEIDDRIQVHNRIGISKPRFEYGKPDNYREVVMDGRQKVNAWLVNNPDIATPLPEDALLGCPTVEGL